MKHIKPFKESRTLNESSDNWTLAELLSEMNHPFLYHILYIFIE